jgi:predicted lysophospholipase L1 biosynthesis ABC-type transport system permease subunit
VETIVASMNHAIISALACLCGSVVGAIAPILGNYLFQKSLPQQYLLNPRIVQCQTLYSDSSNAAVMLPLSLEVKW